MSVAHHYRVGVDLRSIRCDDASPPPSSAVYLRFSYPAFGSHETRPPVPLAAGEETLLPSSFCAFEFCMAPARLERTLEAEPLVVEVLTRGGASVGVVRVPLAGLLRAPSHGGGAGLRVTDAYLPVVDGSGEGRAGSVRAVLSLEDFGEQQQPQPASQQDEANVRETIEYQVAWELEAWRRTERARFTEELRATEQRRLGEMEAEFRRQELLRERRDERRQAELAQLERRLRQSLFEVERQEKALALAEEQLTRRGDDYRRQFELQKEEVAAQVRVLQENHRQQLELSRQRAQDMRTQNEHLRKAAAQADSRRQAAVAELAAARDKFAKTTAGRMREELSARDAELARTRERLEESESARDRLKTQLVRGLKELARARQERADEERARVERQRADLQRAQLAARAKRHAGGLGSERLELAGIKEQLHGLLNGGGGGGEVREAAEAAAPTLSFGGSNGGGDDNDGGKAKAEADVARREADARLPPEIRAEVERLEAERADLLRGGVYTEEHPLATGLRRHADRLRAEAAKPRREPARDDGDDGDDGDEKKRGRQQRPKKKAHPRSGGPRPRFRTSV